MEKDIKLFLQTISNNYDQLPEKDKKKITEFYLEYHYCQNNKSVSEKDTIKFLSLGWFMTNVSHEYEKL